VSELISRIAKYADTYEMLPEAGLILACVSGGADSVFLLEALLEIQRSRKFTVAVAHYNHKLRGDESDRDEAFVRRHCLERGAPVFVGSGDVMAYAKKGGVGLEEAARDMRYAFFHETAERTGAGRIATGHTADDNAETMLLNLIRGAGSNGLSGIPPRRDNITRPILRVSKDELLAYLHERDVSFVDDSTNSLDVFTRNKVRHAIIPVIRGINPRFHEVAAIASELLRDDERFISGIADSFIEQRCVGLTAEAIELAQLPVAVSRRVIRKLCGRNIAFVHVSAVLGICGSDDPSASIALPGLTVYREYDRIVFSPKEETSEDSFALVYPTDVQKTVLFGAGLGAGLKMSCKMVVCSDIIQYEPQSASNDTMGEGALDTEKLNKSFTSFLFKSADICGKIAVRPRLEGDSIRLIGHGGTKTLKKLFIERRIPVRKRALIPVVADDEGVLAVYGIGAGDRAVPGPGDLAFQIDFEEI